MRTRRAALRAGALAVTALAGCSTGELTPTDERTPTGRPADRDATVALS